MLAQMSAILPPIFSLYGPISPPPSSMFYVRNTRLQALPVGLLVEMLCILDTRTLNILRMTSRHFKQIIDSHEKKVYNRSLKLIIGLSSDRHFSVHVKHPVNIPLTVFYYTKGGEFDVRVRPDDVLSSKIEENFRILSRGAGHIEIILVGLPHVFKYQRLFPILQMADILNLFLGAGESINSLLIPLEFFVAPKKELHLSGEGWMQHKEDAYFKALRCKVLIIDFFPDDKGMTNLRYIASKSSLEIAAIHYMANVDVEGLRFLIQDLLNDFSNKIIILSIENAFWPEFEFNIPALRCRIGKENIISVRDEWKDFGVEYTLGRSHVEMRAWMEEEENGLRIAINAWCEYRQQRQDVIVIDDEDENDYSLTTL